MIPFNLVTNVAGGACNLSNFIYNKFVQNDSKMEKLDPISTVFMLAALSFFEKGVRISLKNKRITIQPGGKSQVWDRNNNGDKADDLAPLLPTVKDAITLLDVADPRIALIFKTAIEGCTVLHSTYSIRNIPRHGKAKELLSGVSELLNSALQNEKSNHNGDKKTEKETSEMGTQLPVRSSIDVFIRYDKFWNIKIFDLAYGHLINALNSKKSPTWYPMAKSSAFCIQRITHGVSDVMQNQLKD